MILRLFYFCMNLKMDFSGWEAQIFGSFSVLGVFARNVLIIASSDSFHPWAKFSLDFLLLILPLTLSTTILYDYWAWVILFMLVSSIAVCCYKLTETLEYADISCWQQCLSEDFPPLLGFLSDCRAFTLIATNLCILAVDFKVFPKHFQKSDRFGSSVMDIGVGSFVMTCHGMVSPEARGILDRSRSLTDKLKILNKSLMSSFMLILLGLIRLVSTSRLEYRMDVIEYGLHWNFFFTLAAVKILSTAIQLVIPSKYSLLTALSLMGCYELALTRFDFATYIFQGHTGSRGQRTDIIDANREGLLSNFGYLTLYLVGVTCGRYLFLIQRDKLRDWLLLLCQGMAASIILLISLHISVRHFGGISRKLANLSYIIWIIFYNFVVLSFLLGAEIFFSILIKIKYSKLLKQTMPDCPRGMDRVNQILNGHQCLLRSTTYNGLLFFLLGNVLTGVINHVMDTRSIDYFPSFIIISLYMLTVTIVCEILHSNRIHAKFW